MARSCVPALSGPFYLLLLLFLLTAGVTSASDEDADAKPRTAYACENEALTLECEEGRVIRIQRANYGRFAIDVCNKYGETEGWSVQCFSPKSKDTISERCDGRAQCLMKVNNDVFGDPCHLTPKYAEVKYVCQPVLSRMSESTTTDRPTPAPMQKKIPRGGSPQPPRITSAVAISPTEVEVLWTQAEPTNPVLTTAIYFTDHGMRLGPSPFYSSNSGSAVIKDLRPDSSYDIFLKSFNAQGPSVSSNVVTVRTPPQRQLSTPGTITASTSGTLPLSAYIRVSSSKSDHGSQDPGAVPTDQGDTDTGILTPELLSEMEEAENGTEARLGASRSAGRNSHAADAYADDNADGTAALIGSQPPENSENLPKNEHPLESGIHFDEEKRELTFDLDLSNSNEKNIFMGFLNHLLKSGQDEKSEYGEGGAHEDIGSKLDVESGTVVEGSDIEPRVAKDESGSNVTNPVTENQSGSDVTDPVPEIESGGTDVINKYTEAKLGEPSDLKLEMSPDGTLTTDLLPRRDDDGLAGSGVGDSEDEENDGESEDRRTVPEETTEKPEPPPKTTSTQSPTTTTTTSTTTSSTTTTRAPLTRSPPHVAGDGDDDDDDDHSSPWPTPSIEINDKHGTPPQRRPVLTYCKETVRDDMRWPRTRFGHVARRNCSGGQTGVAKWQCLSTGWFKFGPDLSDCVSVWLDAQLKSVESETPVNEAAAELSESVKSRPMTSGDLKLAATKMLPTLGKGLQRDMGVIPPMLRKRRMKKFKKDVMNTGSHLLSEDNQESWQGLSRQDRVWSATSLLLSMEDTGFQSAAVMDLGASEVTVDENIVMEVSVLDTGTSQRDVVFPSSSSLAHTPWSTSSDSITLTRDSVREAGGTGRLNVVFSIYRNMNELIQPEDNKLPSMPSDPDFNSGTIRDSEKDGKRRQPSVIVNTNIISASVHGRRPGMRLADPVRFTLHHLQPNNEAVPACSFWDVDQSAKSGRWSQDGCRMLDTNSTHTTCECDHLTNFAVLMDISGTELSRDAELGLIWVTYIGCALSIICLLLAWITFTVFKNLQCDRNTIHKNLVLTLMLAELVFLAGIAQVEHKILCSIIAGVLHFLFLSAFAWMCLEGVQLYVMLVEVFEQERSRLPWYYLFGYGTPVIIVAVSAGVNYQGYGTDKHCWLSTENHFIWSFVGPVLVVMLVNIVMLGIAIYIMCRHSNMSATMKERSKVTKFRAWVKGAVVLMVLLGVTWLVGLLFLNKHMVVMAYLFTILNSLQGLFIFLFHCIMNEKVQKEYRKVARRTSWLPDCIRINYGGYNGGATTSPNASSGSGNFLSRLFGQGRKQSAASTNSSARPFLQKDAHLRSDGENSSSRDNSTAPSSLNGYVYNPQMYSNGHSKAPLLMNNNGGVKGSNNGQLLTPCYETLDGVAGDLSEYLECSVVNSEFVSEYCQDNMQVSQERRRYSTGSEDSEMMSSQLPVPHVMDHDNLSNLSVASSTRKPASFAMTSDLGDHADLDDPNYEEPLPGDGQLDLLQYIIPAKKRNGEEEDSGCDTTQDRRTRVGVGENRHLSPAAAAASEGKSSSLNKLTKPAGLSLSSIPETTDPSSPQHSSTPNLQFVPGYVAPLPHATSSPITNGPPDMSLFPSAVAAACPVVSSPDSDKSSLPNLAVDPLTVEVTDNGSHDSDHKKRHSSGADLQFSPFKFSSSDC